ncbi:DUF1482 family protein [Enterobacter ludwigii]|jgi:hypothetical protein|uniref:DUF1482 family protein n=1 Tax=Enterobacter ludwigii TaxID=299767 RepID=UPI001065741A
MQNIATGPLLWALVVHALVNGDYHDAVLDVYDSRKECIHIKEEQRITGECYEITSIINKKST